MKHILEHPNHLILLQLLNDLFTGVLVIFPVKNGRSHVLVVDPMTAKWTVRGRHPVGEEKVTGSPGWLNHSVKKTSGDHDLSTRKGMLSRSN